MKIYLMRHYKVDHTWKNAYTSFGFNQACTIYDHAAIIKKEQPLNVEFKTVYTSTLSRTNETAEALGIEAKSMPAEILNEVPIQSFMKLAIPIPTIVWFVIGRIQWYFNSKNQVEGKRDTIQRIRKFVHQIELENQDCLIIGHGFYFSQMKIILKTYGYIGSNTSYYKNGQVVAFENRKR